jgi:hypothetical protein
MPGNRPVIRIEDHHLQQPFRAETPIDSEILIV